MTQQNEIQLSNDEISRYARHIVLPEIGGHGQQRLKAAKVLVIGAGGLGSPVLQYLAAAGIGTIGIIDDDHVSLSNLQRQIIHDSDKIGEAKVTSAKTALARINPHSTIHAINERLTNENGRQLLENYDIIVDGCDNFSTRYLLADLCEDIERPLVSGAIGRFDGSVTILMPYKDNNPRYRDLFPVEPPEGTVPSCAQAGVVGALPGVIGSLQAMEVIKLITGAGQPLIGRLLLYDGLNARFDTISYKRKTA
ncbi:molybdopterin-synthase adenylyltransferase MoeB [Bartonella sp. HY329]|uniref:molybdopterin-synthase adenylyltransferase MoeB n=1 Tax=unclassified Bartonella TaxID=2645622 RepID=UPI0021C9BB5C|nr:MULTISPECIES: molybdopterin-synthase adenylyltransferase MoeB [unclassified Bartonella]UXM95512.1 molybdopterin-synthase adenylyltransferase MoeB [Bartonella sp. HY329]UXN09837.1 molybdopterin-synthase adenylyltransferase MoeB [Bartonella sp. HY328]